MIVGQPDVDFAEPAPETDLGVMSHVLRDLRGAFERARAADINLAGFAAHSLTTTYLGSTTGLRRRFVQPTGSFQMMGRSLDGKRSTWSGIGTADFTDVSIDDVENELRYRLELAERTFEMPAGRYDVVMSPSAVADMMIRIYAAAVGQNAEDGKSVFSRPGGGTRIGDQLSALPFELRSDPADPLLACTPFLATTASSAQSSVFDNGVGLERTEWISEGRLERLMYHRAGAARLDARFTGPISNLTLELPGATGTTADLVESTERGLLVNSLWYIREVDPSTLLLTGLTRDGVYLIEDGHIVGQINNFRFNESPVDLLARSTQVGETVRALGRETGDSFNRTAMPPLRVAQFNMSSVSPAS